MCLSDIICSRCPRSWSVAGSPNLCRNVKFRVHQLHNNCSFIDVELTTPGGVHWRKSTRKSPVSGSVLKGHRSSCPAQGLITQTNHTSMNYKYYLVWAFQGMTSSLQSKVPPQNSGATGLCVPLRYTLFKVSAQLVCSWLPYSMHESETPVTSTRQYL